MAVYSIGGRLTSQAETGYAELIETAYKDHVRPLCMCHEPGIPMYIARFEETYIVKRMPDSGENHSPGCESYETPAGLSGRREVEGSAIQEEDGGTTNLKFAFSLSLNGKNETPAEAMEKSSAAAPGTRLTLRGLLHYLWEESHLSHWVPGMTGKRNWLVIRKYLQIAAEAKESKRAPLSDVLYIPEFYIPARAREIEANRLRKLSPIMGTGAAGKKKMILIGEMDTVPEKSHYGSVLAIKQLPDYNFFLSDDLAKSFQKIFKETLTFYGAHKQFHLMVIATFMIHSHGVPEIQEMAVMLVNEQWIPVEHQTEHSFIATLVREQRSFHKELRYNLTSDKPIACATLTDVENPPLAVYLKSQEFASGSPSNDELLKLMETSKVDTFLHDPADEKASPIPPKHGFRTAAEELKGAQLNA